MTTVNPPISFPRREIAPGSHQLWLRGKQGKLAPLEKEFSEWIAEIQSNEELFKTHVYDNADPSAGSIFRQHRASLT